MSANDLLLKQSPVSMHKNIKMEIKTKVVDTYQKKLNIQYIKICVPRIINTSAFRNLSPLYVESIHSWEQATLLKLHNVELLPALAA